MDTENKNFKTAPRPIVMLDIDDVLCLSYPYSGKAVIELFAGKRTDGAVLFPKLFKSYAVEVLRRIHERMGSGLSYVITSTWRLSFDRDQMVQIFNESGASFVADSLRPGNAWRTPELPEGTRAQEIDQWLKIHGRDEPFVILDDTYSGKSFFPVRADSLHPWHRRVVLCEEYVGLLHEHEPAIMKALTTPAPNNKAKAE